MNRLTFTALASTLAATLAGRALADAPAPSHVMPPGMEPPKEMQRIAMMVYPKMTAMDLIGPQLLFASLMNVDVQLVWKDRTTVISDTGVPIVPTATFADIDSGLTVLFVPGGTKGTFAAMNDREVLAFLGRVGPSAAYVTSVCTGALVLGAAGLLRGYRATTHWAVRDVLPILGAIPSAERVVEDRNRITGAGVTAGLDFGLHMAAKLRSDDYARMLQLAYEYDPQPPFDAGSPAKAGPHIATAVRSFYAPVLASATEAAETARKRLAF